MFDTTIDKRSVIRVDVTPPAIAVSEQGAKSDDVMS